MADQQILESFMCPLTHEVMRDPVVDPEGNTYERAAIEEWLRKDATSPITRTPLTMAQLVPNRALRDIIEARAGGAVAPVPAHVPVVAAPDNQAAQKIVQKKPTVVGSDPIDLRVSAQKIPDTQDEYYVLASIVPPEGAKRTPVDVCCVIDISGSMGEEAVFKNATGGVESRGLSLLDVVKHAVKTISHSLEPTDRLAIVTYHTTAALGKPLTFMKDKDKKEFDAYLDSLQPEDTTNIWDGLQMGLELLRKETKPGRVSSLLLLTDGQPNVSPPSGEVRMFTRYIDQNQQLSCSVNTFGFGYKIQSELLCGLAEAGNGMFAFIPDSSFVGTVFVNSATNLLATMGTNVSLSFEPLNDTKVVSVLGAHKVETPSWGALVSLSSLQHGQSLDVVLKMTIPAGLAKDTPFVNVTLKYDHWSGGQQVVVSTEGVDREGTAEVMVQTRRLLLVQRLGELMGKSQSKKEIVEEMRNSLKDGKDKREKAMLEDVEGQITEAIAPEAFVKWGKHYLPSLAHAHLRQQCNNFKDPGVQTYGGELFRKTRDMLEDIFVKLPPPTSTRAPKSGYGGGGGATKKKGLFSFGSSSSSSAAPAYVAPTYDMGDYYNRGGGCFLGSCTVRMADGSFKKVQDVAKGDRVFSKVSAANANTVLCVLKISYEEGRAELVEMEGGLVITPYHPVRVEGQWRFPRDLAAPSVRECEAVYTFVLGGEGSHTMLVNGVECVTLGHGYTEDVVAHAFFGSNKIVEALSGMRGWEAGQVEVQSDSFTRDPKTNMVVGFCRRCCASVEA